MAYNARMHKKDFYFDFLLPARLVFKAGCEGPAAPENSEVGQLSKPPDLTMGDADEAMDAGQALLEQCGAKLSGLPDVAAVAPSPALKEDISKLSAAELFKDVDAYKDRPDFPQILMGHLAHLDGASAQEFFGAGDSLMETLKSKGLLEQAARQVSDQRALIFSNPNESLLSNFLSCKDFSSDLKRDVVVLVLAKAPLILVDVYGFYHSEPWAKDLFSMALQRSIAAVPQTLIYQYPRIVSGELPIEANDPAFQNLFGYLSTQGSPEDLLDANNLMGSDPAISLKLKEIFNSWATTQPVKAIEFGDLVLQSDGETPPYVVAQLPTITRMLVQVMALDPAALDALLDSLPLIVSYESSLDVLFENRDRLFSGLSASSLDSVLRGADDLALFFGQADLLETTEGPTTNDLLVTQLSAAFRKGPVTGDNITSLYRLTAFSDTEKATILHSLLREGSEAVIGSLTVASAEALLKSYSSHSDELLARAAGDYLYKNAPDILLVDTTVRKQIMMGEGHTIDELAAKVLTTKPLVVLENYDALIALGLGPDLVKKIEAARKMRSALEPKTRALSDGEELRSPLEDPALSQLAKMDLAWLPSDLEPREAAKMASYILRNLYLKGEEVSQESVQSEYALIKQLREEKGGETLFADKHVVLIANNELLPDGRPRFARGAFREAVRSQQKDGGELAVMMPEAGASVRRLSQVKEEILSLLESILPPMSIVFDGHGSADGLFISQGVPNEFGEVTAGVHITPQELATVFAKRAGYFGPDAIRGEVIILGTCFNANFLRTFYAELASKGLPLPAAVGTSEYNQYGYSNFDNKYGNDFFDKVLEVQGERSTIGDVWKNDDAAKDLNPSVFVPDGQDLIQLGDNKNPHRGGDEHYAA